MTVWEISPPRRIVTGDVLNPESRVAVGLLLFMATMGCCRCGPMSAAAAVVPGTSMLAAAAVSAIVAKNRRDL